MERLNYFSPYQSKGAWHEDQLTRAFLVVVRMVPLALASLLDLIREQQAIRGSESRIPTSSEILTGEIEIQTQKNSIPQTTGRLVSVVTCQGLISLDSDSERFLCDERIQFGECHRRHVERRMNPRVVVVPHGAIDLRH